MKKILMISMVVFASYAAYSQKCSDMQVPATVKVKVNMLYPNIKVEQWKKNVDGNYQANLDVNKTELKLTLSPLGDLLNTKTKILVDELPAAVKDYVIKFKEAKKISAAYKETDVNGIITNYKATVEKTCLIFDSNGAYINSVNKDQEYKKYKN